MPELEAVDGVAIVPVRNRGGRPKGSRNKITRDLKEAACRYTLRSLRVLWKLASESPEPMIRLKAACELLDRAHGKPSQVQLIGGTGQPIQSQQLTVEISQRIASVFGQVATVDPDKPVGEQLDDQSLRVVSAISYLQASAEAAQSPREPAGSSASANGVSAAAAPAVTPAAPEVFALPALDLLESPALDIGERSTRGREVSLLHLAPDCPARKPDACADVLESDPR